MIYLLTLLTLLSLSSYCSFLEEYGLKQIISLEENR